MAYQEVARRTSSAESQCGQAVTSGAPKLLVCKWPNNSLNIRLNRASFGEKTPAVQGSAMGHLTTAAESPTASRSPYHLFRFLRSQLTPDGRIMR
jgi:hypothetical protein